MLPLLLAFRILYANFPACCRFPPFCRYCPHWYQMVTRCVSDWACRQRVGMVMFHVEHHHPHSGGCLTPSTVGSYAGKSSELLPACRIGRQGSGPFYLCAWLRMSRE